MLTGLRNIVSFSICFCDVDVCGSVFESKWPVIYLLKPALEKVGGEVVYVAASQCIPFEETGIYRHG